MKIKKRIKNVNISSDNQNLVERASSQKRILNEDTAFEIIEAYKAARTNIMFSLNGESGCKKIIITSPTSGEGKTTTCINLAMTFAQTDAKVLVMDSDLRAPRVHRYMKLENDNGLSNVLAGFSSLNDCIHTDVLPNLDCLTSGAIPPNPVELLSSEKMLEVFAELESKYEYIFIDTPPLNIVTEALILSKHTTGVILVTRQKYSIYKMIERSINSLNFAGAKILGFILNDANDDKYVYGGYKINSSYRYGGKRSKYVRYGYFSSDHKKSVKNRAESAEKDAESEKNKKAEKSRNK